MGEWSVRAFDAERWDDFRAFHCAQNGAGWCFCVAWWVETWEGWGERTAAQNLALRQELCARGEHDGYLLYDGARPVGWCQVGRRDRLAKLVRQYVLEPDPGAWAVTCFEIAPGSRRRGAASFLLGEVLADLARRGVERVQAFPRRGAGEEEGRLWTGPEGMYARAGFRVVREDPHRPVMEWTGAGAGLTRVERDS